MNTDPKSSNKPRRPKNKKTQSWAAAFDKEERTMIRNLKKATGDVLSCSQIQRAAVRFAVPKFLSGEVPINGRVSLTPATKSTG